MDSASSEATARPTPVPVLRHAAPEDLLAERRRPLVAHPDLHMRVEVLGHYLDPAGAVGRGVLEQYVEDLRHRPRRHPDRDRSLIDLDDAAVRAREPGAPALDRLADDLVQVDRGRRDPPTPGHVEQLGDRRAEPVQLAEHAVQVVGDLGRGLRPQGDVLDLQPQGGDRRAQLVRGVARRTRAPGATSSSSCAARGTQRCADVLGLRHAVVRDVEVEAGRCPAGRPCRASSVKGRAIRRARKYPTTTATTVRLRPTTTSGSRASETRSSTRSPDRATVSSPPSGRSCVTGCPSRHPGAARPALTVDPSGATYSTYSARLRVCSRNSLVIG